jgi:GTP-binding protein
MSRPVVAIVGRPNVGKSTLFNKLIGRRTAIVEDTPGVTRDRIYSPCEWRGRQFLLVDTGGIEPYSCDEILVQMRRQAQLAIDSADAVILVCDVRTGITATDQEVALMLQKSGKPIVLCVTKADSIGLPPPELYEFYNLGLGEPIAVSGLHGHGTGDLLDAVFDNIDFVEFDADRQRTSVAVIGKPNVGKSSLINRILGSERLIVTDTAGTTRDAVDTEIDNEFGSYLFIDTAGIRRKAKVVEAIERYSVVRALMAIERADVCVLMIDAQQEYSEQDSRIAGYAHEQGKGCVVAVNKWDLIEKDEGTMNSFQKKLEQNLAFMSYAPFVFISAKTGLRTDKLFEHINKAAHNNSLRITTGALNEVLGYATARVQPPSDRGKRLKIYYMTQTSTKPPTFVLFVNRKDLFHFSYQRYLENQIRQSFDLTATPVRFIIRERDRGDVN